MVVHFGLLYQVQTQNIQEALIFQKKLQDKQVDAEVITLEDYCEPYVLTGKELKAYRHNRTTETNRGKQLGNLKIIPDKLKQTLLKRVKDVARKAIEGYVPTKIFPQENGTFQIEPETSLPSELVDIVEQ